MEILLFCLDELETSHDESLPSSSQPMQEGPSAAGQQPVEDQPMDGHPGDGEAGISGQQSWAGAASISLI